MSHTSDSPRDSPAGRTTRAPGAAVAAPPTSAGRPAGEPRPGTRQAQKQQTRRALLDAGLRLLEHQNLSSLGLRELTREVGVSPAAFYRHFPDMDGLGVALVGEALGSLHEVVRAVLADGADGSAPDALIDRTVAITAAYVDAHRPHVRFIARERHGGVRTVREAIAAELGRFTDEVAAGLAVQPASDGWTAAELHVLAGLHVDHMVATAAELLEAPLGDAAERDRIMRAARLRMRIISVGRLHWLDPD
ncbi:putative TetR family transcriptional regulator [Actinacidiphila reveromycinica]|uniref:Putative TetR family transcriptional regulator n=1 Tax=Actinacidiphila reveromycinica TaxID=659352 RepID=A0A7U3UZD1_9ACTN|nr:TetR family transcriptional regulator [Streptomyces sp. SN-593]BBB01606.1 putative TetR family transcriptional regulator [Streptomyces sp. SN-593]